MTAPNQPPKDLYSLDIDTILSIGVPYMNEGWAKYPDNQQHMLAAFRNTRGFKDAKAALQAYTSEQERKAWAKGWADRSAAEDYTDIIGRLRATKPQDGAFFLIGEIEQVVKDLIAQRTRLKGESK